MTRPILGPAARWCITAATTSALPGPPRVGVLDWPERILLGVRGPPAPRLP
ncbi:hypothetical protein [Streptomyces sp. NPDC059991]|uniref:hypothetical protein n=1 Tax=unclassified Streptomyces TaxID=2593676 RepID=UPI0036946CBB